MSQLPESYQSMAYLAVGLQLSVAVVQTALQVLDIKPAYYQNGTAFYGDAARTKLIEHLVERDMLHHLERGR